VSANHVHSLQVRPPEDDFLRTGQQPTRQRCRGEQSEMELEKTIGGLSSLCSIFWTCGYDKPRTVYCVSPGRPKYVQRSSSAKMVEGSSLVHSGGEAKKEDELLLLLTNSDHKTGRSRNTNPTSFHPPPPVISVEEKSGGDPFQYLKTLS